MTPTDSRCEETIEVFVSRLTHSGDATLLVFPAPASGSGAHRPGQLSPLEPSIRMPLTNLHGDGKNPGPRRRTNPEPRNNVELVATFGLR